MNEPDNQNKSTTPQPRDVVREPKGDSSKNRQWLPKFRFSMRTLFILVTLLCVLLVPLSVKLYQARQQRLAVEWVLANGGKVSLNESGEVVKVFFSDYNTQITDAGLVHLKGLTSLKSLSLDHTQISDTGLEHLKSLTSLRALILTGTQITDAGLKHLKGLTRLDQLYLGGTQITDAGLKHLKGLTSLRALHLTGTQVTGTGLVHLKDMTRLRHLNLNNTQITDAGVEHLKGLTSLTHLGLERTQVTNAGLSELKAALPKFKGGFPNWNELLF